MVSGALVGSHGVAADASGDSANVGAKSCASFLREFEEKSIGRTANFAWLAGYIPACLIRLAGPDTPIAAMARPVPSVIGAATPRRWHPTHPG